MSSLHRALSLCLAGLVAGTVAGSLACKNDDGSVSADDAAETLAEAACRLYYECDCEADPPLYTSEADCKLELASELQSGIDQGREEELSYDDSCPGVWLDVLDALGCAYLIEIILDTDLHTKGQEANACKLFHGTKEEGDDCIELDGGVGDDCDVNLECNDQGQCEELDFGQPEGSQCTPSDNDCAPGLVCIDVTGGDNEACEDLPVSGETCMGAGNLCDIHLYCELESKTCAPLPGSGDACAPNPGIFLGACDMNSVCENDDVCVDLPTGGQDCVNERCALGFVCEGLPDNRLCAEDSPYACIPYFWY